jgi:ABC-type Zn uptake system ZnuABC Zn-binding protein ZnuA
MMPKYPGNPAARLLFLEKPIQTKWRGMIRSFEADLLGGLVLLVSVSLLLAGCSGNNLPLSPPSAVTTGPIKVAVVAPPYAWLVRQIAGPRAEPVLIFRGSTCAESFQPADAEVSQILSCKILLRAGLPFENSPWFRSLLAAGNFRVVDLRQAGLREPMVSATSAGEEDSPGHHEHLAGRTQLRSMVDQHHKYNQNTDNRRKSSNQHSVLPSEGDLQTTEQLRQETGVPELPSSPEGDLAMGNPATGAGVGFSAGTSQPIHANQKRITAAEHEHLHHECCEEHGTTCGHHHSTEDPHLWLSPRLVKIHAQLIAEVLGEVDKQNAHFYKENASKFIEYLDRVDQEIRTTLSAVKGRRFLVFHPAWGHFAVEYGLEQIAVEREGNPPSEAELADLARQLRAYGARAIVVESADPHHPATSLARGLQLEAVTISPTEEKIDETLRKIAKFVVDYAF